MFPIFQGRPQLIYLDTQIVNHNMYLLIAVRYDILIQSLRHYIEVEKLQLGSRKHHFKKLLKKMGVLGVIFQSLSVH